MGRQRPRRSLEEADVIDVYVIGVEDALRSPELSEALESCPFPVTFVPPYRPEADALPTLTDSDAAELIFGRGLTIGEIGCWFAHRITYENILARGSEWSLILEDDAGLPRAIWSDLPSWVAPLDATRPIILSLFAQEAPRGHRVEAPPGVDMRALPYAPTNTVAYVMNRRAVAVALKGPRRAISTADWPPWSLDVDFFLMSESPVKHEAQSLIGARPDPSFALRPLVRLASVVSPRAWAAGRPYFRDVRGYLQWAVLIPARKALGRARKRIIPDYSA